MISCFYIQFVLHDAALPEFSPAYTDAERARLFLPTWLRLLSLSTPVFVLLTFGVSLVHTSQHHTHIRSTMRAFAVRESTARLAQTDQSGSTLSEPILKSARFEGLDDSRFEDTADVQRYSDRLGEGDHNPYFAAIFPYDLSIQVIALPVVYSMMAFKVGYQAISCCRWSSR